MYICIGVPFCTLCLKKVPTFKLSVTLSNLNRVAKLLHCWKAYEICYKIVHITHLTLGTLLHYLGKLKIKFSAYIQQIWKKMQTNCILSAPILIPVRMLLLFWVYYMFLSQVAQLWQRDRASSINDFRWGSIWGYYRLRSYFSRHCDTTQFTVTHHMVKLNKPFLLLGLAAEYRSRRRRLWCANNIASDHQMFITLTGQLSWQRLRRSAVDLYSKAKKSPFEPPFRALRGNIRTPSMACWKARGRLYIHRNWTFFTISYCWDVMSGIGRSRRFSKGVGHFERRFQREGNVADQPLLVPE